MTDASVTKHGRDIARIDELAWPATWGHALLGELRALAQKAHASSREMYLWMSA